MLIPYCCYNYHWEIRGHCSAGFRADGEAGAQICPHVHFSGFPNCDQGASIGPHGSVISLCCLLLYCVTQKQQSQNPTHFLGESTGHLIINNHLKLLYTPYQNKGPLKHVNSSLHSKYFNATRHKCSSRECAVGKK